MRTLIEERENKTTQAGTLYLRNLLFRLLPARSGRTAPSPRALYPVLSLAYSCEAQRQRQPNASHVRWLHFRLLLGYGTSTAPYRQHRHRWAGEREILAPTERSQPNKRIHDEALAGREWLLKLCRQRGVPVAEAMISPVIGAAEGVGPTVASS
jgi:hypothetical protein